MSKCTEQRQTFGPSTRDLEPQDCQLQQQVDVGGLMHDPVRFAQGLYGNGAADMILKDLTRGLPADIAGRDAPVESGDAAESEWNSTGFGSPLLAQNIPPGGGEPPGDSGGPNPFQDREIELEKKNSTVGEEAHKDATKELDKNKVTPPKEVDQGQKEPEPGKIKKKPPPPKPLDEYVDGKNPKAPKPSDPKSPLTRPLEDYTKQIKKGGPSTSPTPKGPTTAPKVPTIAPKVPTTAPKGPVPVPKGPMTGPKVGPRFGPKVLPGWFQLIPLIIEILIQHEESKKPDPNMA